MCLRYPLDGKEKQEAIAALPETFFVWKFCPAGKGRTEFNCMEFRAANDGILEPQLTENKWYEAQNFPASRSFLDYQPGFHAFLDYDEAESYYYKEWYSRGRLLSTQVFKDRNAQEFIFKFEARRKDVKEIGRFDDGYGNLRGVVLQFIKPVLQENSDA